MLITESGKSELLGGRREANGGGGRNGNMRNGNAERIWRLSLPQL